MATNRKQRCEKLNSLLQRLEEHKGLIRDQLDLEYPNWGVIQHWAGEAKNWQLQVQRLRAKLPGGR